jgi:hypothetical protein
MVQCETASYHPKRLEPVTSLMMTLKPWFCKAILLPERKVGVGWLRV